MANATSSAFRRFAEVQIMPVGRLRSAVLHSVFSKALPGRKLTT